MRDADRALAALLLALDRCEHGRHKGDRCTGSESCNGPSVGNKFLQPGQRLGTDMYGRSIVYPKDHRVLGVVDYWVPEAARSIARPV